MIAVLFPGKSRQETNEERTERKRKKYPIFRSHVDPARWIQSIPGINSENEREREKREG